MFYITPVLTTNLRTLRRKLQAHTGEMEIWGCEGSLTRWVAFLSGMIQSHAFETTAMTNLIQELEGFIATKEKARQDQNSQFPGNILNELYSELLPVLRGIKQSGEKEGVPVEVSEAGAAFSFKRRRNSKKPLTLMELQAAELGSVRKKRDLSSTPLPTTSLQMPALDSLRKFTSKKSKGEVVRVRKEGGKLQEALFQEQATSRSLKKENTTLRAAVTKLKRKLALAKKQAVVAEAQVAAVTALEQQTTSVLRATYYQIGLILGLQSAEEVVMPSDTDGSSLSSFLKESSVLVSGNTSLQVTPEGTRRGSLPGVVPEWFETEVGLSPNEMGTYERNAPAGSVESSFFTNEGGEVSGRPPFEPFGEDGEPEGWALGSYGAPSVRFSGLATRKDSPTAWGTEDTQLLTPSLFPPLSRTPSIG